MGLELISFDLQGTLCDHAYSSEIWGPLLMEEFEAARLRLGEAGCAALLKDFKRIGEEDARYYDIRYWLKRAGSPAVLKDLARRAAARPRLFPEMMEVVERCSRSVPVIILSATTREFIELELAQCSGAFARTYSSFDDFGVCGKPPALFKTVAEELGCEPKACLHIGDHPEMDGANPQRAGWHSLFHPAALSPATRAKAVMEYLEC